MSLTAWTATAAWAASSASTRRSAAARAAEQLPRGWVPALEHGLEPGHGCFALQPQAVGAGASERILGALLFSENGLG